MAMMFVGVLEILVHGPVSPVLNPLPVIVTGVLNGPLVGVRVIVGDVEVMVNVAVAKSPVLPVTVTVYVPAVVLPTTKLVLITLPFVIVHVGNEMMLIGVLEIVVHASPVLNPLPVIVTGVLNGPDTGERVIVGPVTTKFAVPKSPVVPRTFTTYVPGVTGLATVNAVPVN